MSPYAGTHSKALRFEILSLLPDLRPVGDLAQVGLRRLSLQHRREFEALGLEPLTRSVENGLNRWLLVEPFSFSS